MSPQDWIYIILFITLLVISVPLIGTYVANVFQETGPSRHPFRWLESLSYRLAGINPKIEMDWKSYASALLLFNLFGFLLVFFIQLMQFFLPLNPQQFQGVSGPLAFNTAISFTTNTNWQAYSGETTLSYFTQMFGLTVQNFLSAATGLAALLTLIRGLTRKCTHFLGNFWVDLVRSVVYILLPGAIILAVLLLTQGVIQTWQPYVEIKTLEGGSQTIPLGPVASQVAIKQLGTNGGGFFNANSAHPFENPSPISSFLELFAIVCIPAALTYTYGIMVGSKRHGWYLFNIMLLIWIAGLAVSFYSQHLYNPIVQSNYVKEGMETRLTISNNMLWSTVTTATANGSVSSMIESLSPLAGGVSLFNIMLGENIFGGIGVGMSSMIMFVLLTLFLSGLMVGRTPEYLGKKIEKGTIQWVMVAILTPVCLILLGTSLALVFPDALSSLTNKGPHGFTSVLYAFSSSSGNNGSAFAGLKVNTPFFNITLGIVMLLARLAILIPTLAVAGELVKKKIAPPLQEQWRRIIHFLAFF